MRENREQREIGLLAMVEISRLTEQAFDLSVQTFGCVECARKEMVQHAQLMASGWDMRICGEQTDGEPPAERDGIKRLCNACEIGF